MWPTDNTTKSHYYSSPLPRGTWMDCAYHQGLTISSTIYVAVGGLSNHCSLVCSYELPQACQKVFMPKSIPHYKVKEAVMVGVVFQKRLERNISLWREARVGASVLGTWEYLIKPGICQMARERQKEQNVESKGRLRVLNLLQGRYMERVHGGDFTALLSLKATQREISDFYKAMSDKIILKGKSDNAKKSEKTRIYHHSILQTKIKRTYIGKLETVEGWKVGHEECDEFLE